MSEASSAGDSGRTQIGDDVSLELREGAGVIRLDDGKANALSHAVLRDLDAALDRAEKAEARVLALIGRPGRFSAGFDLSVMGQGPQAAAELVLRGADLAARLYGSAVPVVLGVSGHALAMGAILCLAADERIGADGAFKIGMNEVAIGMTLPDFALLFARERLSVRHRARAASGAEIYDPAGALEAGYLDRVVPAESLEAATVARAVQLGQTLDAVAHRNTKRALRADFLDALRESIARDRQRMQQGARLV